MNYISKAIYIMKPYIVHTTTADYKELPRYQYDLNHTNYTPLKSQMRAVPIGQGFLDYKTFINTGIFVIYEFDFFTF